MKLDTYIILITSSFIIKLLFFITSFRTRDKDVEILIRICTLIRTVVHLQMYAADETNNLLNGRCKDDFLHSFLN